MTVDQHQAKCVIDNRQTDRMMLLMSLLLSSSHYISLCRSFSWGGHLHSSNNSDSAWRLEFRCC